MGGRGGGAGWPVFKRVATVGENSVLFDCLEN